MITGCFMCLPSVWAKAIPLPLKTCLQDTSLSSAGRDTVQNPCQLDSVKCSFSERGMMVCPRMTDQDLDQSLNREVGARTETPGYKQTVVLEELSQNHHKHSLGQDYSVSVPQLRPLHSWVVLKEKDTRNSNNMFFRSFRKGQTKPVHIHATLTAHT